MKNMSREFPWRSHSDEELNAEFLRLRIKVKEKIRFPLSFSIVGFKCTNQLFQFERMRTPGVGRPSTLDYWNKKQEDVIRFSNKMGHDNFRTLNYFNHAPSHFPIVSAAKIYRHFNATKVFDPYAGWGDRCIAAMALDIDYFGIDANKALQKPFRNLIDRYHSSTSNAKVIFQRCEEVDLGVIDFDFVLSSPPFWKKGSMLERYQDIEVEYSTFLKESLCPVIKKCIDRGVWTCLYIPEEMYNDMTVVLGECQTKLECRFNNRNSSPIFCWKNPPI
jgi:hypothetical protein